MDESRLSEMVKDFNRHELEAIMLFFTDDRVVNMPRGSTPEGARAEGKDAVRAALASRVAGIPDVHQADDRHFVSGERGVSEWLRTGTTRGGERVAVRGCDLFELRGEQIRRKDSYWKIVEP